MDILNPEEKKNWETKLDTNLMRTGCTDLWDSIFCCFGNYRNATKEEKKHLILEKYPNAFAESHPEHLNEWISKFRMSLYETNDNRDTDNKKIFFTLLSIRFLELELFPYLKTSLEETITKEEFKQEVEEKIMLLAEHRLKKKAKEYTLEDIEEVIHEVVEELFQLTFFPVFSDQDLLEISDSLGYDILVLSDKEQVLFDSYSEEEKYRDTILIRVCSNGFESIGRLSSIKDGHKKLSRIFSFDDPLIQKLRSDLNKTDE